MAGREIWIGVDEEGTLVFDSRLQIDNCPYLVLWNHSTGEVEKYDAAPMRETIVPLDDGAEKEGVHRCYLAWYEQHGEQWHTEEVAYYAVRAEKEEAKRIQAQQEHAKELSRRMATDNFLQRLEGRYLYHFTDLRNLPLIREHGLLSRAQLQRRGIDPPNPGGNDWSHRADAWSGMDAYVHLCLVDSHPMEHIARTEGRIGDTRFLRISPEVLRLVGVKCSVDVANKSGAAISPICEAISSLDLEILFSTNKDFSNPEFVGRYNEARKSEILIPNVIPINFILNLY